MEIGVGDVIDSLRRELLELQYKAHEQIFLLKEVEIEIKFVVEKSGEGLGKAKVLFLAAEAKGSYKEQNVHTIRVKLGANESWQDRHGRVGPVAPSAG